MSGIEWPVHGESSRLPARITTMPPRDDNWCFDRVPGRPARYRRRTEHGPFVGATYDRDGAVAFLAAWFLSERDAAERMDLAADARASELAWERSLVRDLMRATVKCAVGTAWLVLDIADRRYVQPAKRKRAAA